MPRIILVEDDDDTAGLVSERLADGGFDVATYDRIADAAAGLRDGGADLLVLDRIVPDGDTIELLRTLRTSGRETPCLFISALTSVNQRVDALEAGADDYLVKPFALVELVARAHALVRRAQPRETLLRVGPISVDLVEDRAWRGQRSIDLLPKELNLLTYLMRNAGALVTRSMLLRDVWGYNFEPQSNVVDVHLGKLRRKIDAPGERPLLQTVRGKGFRLEPEGEAGAWNR